MGKVFIDILDDGPPPKRGDIVQTNVGNRRERTWLILSARKMRRAPREYVPLGKLPPRFDVWMARWWELEADFRMRLYRSAQRNGGQNVHHFHRYPAKKKRRPFDSFT
jgi:hypothetical protein